jgi:dTMP kinase
VTVPVPRPWFIAFEGSDASGKTTQAKLLASRLDAVLTREPGDTAVGARIRSLLLDHSPEGAVLDLRAEALLMAADRAQHVAEVIGPALAAGRVVITDRYTASSLAYQGYGRGLDVDAVRRLSEFATDGLWPDVTVLLRVPVEVAWARLRAAGVPDRLESEGPSFVARVIDGFDRLAAADPERWRVVDGVGTIDEVAARVADALELPS